MPALTAQHLRKSFGAHVVLDDASITIARGERVGLIGANGTGKSTLAKILAAVEVPDGGTQFKCCPPVRFAPNREALWRALGAGVIDCVVSDHSPCPPAMKHLADGDFGAAWGGISSVQLSLPVVWTQARERGFSPGDIDRRWRKKIRCVVPAISRLIELKIEVFYYPPACPIVRS